MQRLLITAPRRCVWEDEPMPACAADGILVRAKMTAVSTGTELRVYRAVPVDDEGKFLHERVPFKLPAENGYSMVGEIIEIGREASGFETGERVFAPCTHKEIAAVDAALAVKPPDEIPDEKAAFLNILEVGHIALRRGSPTPGENVAIVGQGVIGLGILAYCKAFGFRTAVIDPNERRLRIARQMGADLAVRLPSEQEDEHRGQTDTAATNQVIRAVIDFFDGAGADLVLEAASSWAAIQTAMDIATENGRIVVVSRHTDTPSFNPVGHPYLGKKLTLLTSYGHEPNGSRWDRRRSFALTVDLMRCGRLDIAPMITHRIDRRELPDVYRRLDDGENSIVGVVARW